MPFKTLTHLLVILLIGNLSAAAQNNIAAIELNIQNANKEAVLILKPLQGQYFAGTRYYDSTDVSGQLNIYLELDQAGFCYLYPQYIHSAQEEWTGIQLYIEPGETYQVNLDMYDPTHQITFGGDNTIEQQLLNRSTRKWLPDELEISDWIQQYIEGKTASDIHQIWSAQRYAELAALQDLADKEQITLDFISAAQEDIAYYHAYLFQKLWAAGVVFQAEQKAEWNAYQEVVIAEKPISNPQALSSMWYHAYCEAYRLHYLEKRHAAELNQKYQSLPDFFTIQYRTYQDYFSSNIHENMLANVIFTEVNNNGSQAPVQAVYRDYLYDFQNSIYLPYLKIFFPNISNPTAQPPLTDYQLPPSVVKAETPISSVSTSERIPSSSNFPTPEGIDIIPNQEDINSLRALLQGFRGKTLYVDIWASWCGPCKEQFAKKKTLENYIKNKDIELLYISIDEDKNIENWQQDIQKYGLKGHHIRANPRLLKEVQDQFGQFGILFLPTYGIVNRYGEVVEAKAKKPSDGEALLRQLERY